MISHDELEKLGREELLWATDAHLRAFDLLATLRPDAAEWYAKAFSYVVAAGKASPAKRESADKERGNT